MNNQKTEAVEAIKKTKQEAVAQKVEVKFGTVANCKRLNVREKPTRNATIKCVIDKSSKVIISDEESTDKWFKVCTDNGVEGFCMKDYVEVNI